MEKLPVWTRAAAHWPEDLKKYPDLKGFYHLPLTEQRPMTVGALDGDLQGFIVTSPQAARLLSKLPSLCQQLSSVPLYTFSEKVAQILASSFQCHMIEASDAAEMLEAMRQKILAPGNRLAFLGALEPAVPVATLLSQWGFPTVHFPLYQTVLSQDLGREDKEVLSRHCLVCLASPSSVKALAQLVSAYGLDLAKMELLVIGKTTAESCRQFLKEPISITESRFEALIAKALEILA